MGKSVRVSAWIRQYREDRRCLCVLWREHSLSNSVYGQCMLEEKNRCLEKDNRWKEVSQSGIPLGATGAPCRGCTKLCATGQESQVNVPTEGASLPGGKAGLSNSGVGGEGSDESVEYSPLFIPISECRARQ